MNEIHPIDARFVAYVKKNRRFRMIVVYLLTWILPILGGLWAMGDWYSALERSQMNYAGSFFAWISGTTSITAFVSWRLANYE